MRDMDQVFTTLNPAVPESPSLTFSVTGVNMSFSFLCWSQFDWVSITYNQKTLKKCSCKEKVQDPRLWLSWGRTQGCRPHLAHSWLPPGPSTKQILSPVRGTIRRISCEIAGFSTLLGWVTATVILHNRPLTAHPPSRVGRGSATRVHRLPRAQRQQSRTGVTADCMFLSLAFFLAPSTA